MSKFIISLLILFIANISKAQTVSLDTSRIAGTAPLYVFFDATKSTCPEGVCTRPFDELHYKWSFGAYGPVAAKVFETGQHKITLTVSSANGISITKEVEINVQDPNQTWAGSLTTCFSTSGNFTNCPAGAIRTTTASFNSIDSVCMNKRRCLLRKGETFTGDDLDIGGPGPGMLGSYGEGNLPILIGTSGRVIDWRNDTNDWRVQDVQLQGNGTSGTLVFSDDNVKDVLFLRIKNTPNSSNSGIQMGLEVLEVTNNPIHDGIGIFDSSLKDFGFGPGGNAIYVAARKLAIINNSVEDTISGEHIMRIQHYDGLVVSKNVLADQANAKAIISLRSAAQNEVCSAACGEPSRNAVVSDNIVRNRSTNAFGVCGINQPQNGEIARCDNTLFERNHFSISTNQPPTSESHRPQYFCCSGGGGNHSQPNVTFRNNVIDMTGLMYGGNLGAREGTRAYNNTCYTATVTSSLVRCTRRFTDQHNNLMYAPGASGQKEVASDFTTASNNHLATTDPFIARPVDFRLKPGSVPFGVNIYNPLDQLGTFRAVPGRVGALNELNDANDYKPLAPVIKEIAE